MLRVRQDGAGAKDISLILVETDREGFRRGRNLDKIGQKESDTSELFLDEVRVPQGTDLALYLNGQRKIEAGRSTA